MKKFIITFLLLATFFFTGNAQASSSDSNHKRKNHRGHNSHGKGDRHHAGIRLFHGHHHGKDHTRSDAHSHHGKGRQGDKGSKDNK
jgi:hypothetical protein